MSTPPDRTVNLRSLPDTKIGNVWLVVGPGWRNHLKWRLQESFSSKHEVYWIGMGDIGSKIPPSGILHGRKDIQRIEKEWNVKDTITPKPNRVLFVEDPQGGGIWGELTRTTAWINLLSKSKSGNYDVVIGTGSPLDMSRLVLENTDYLVLRCSGDDNIRFLTNGSRLSDWLDSIGRELFDDIRVYRKLISLIGNKNRDLVLAMSSEAETLPERIFWWDRYVREKIDEDDGPSHDSHDSHDHHDIHPNKIHLRAKIQAAMTILKEVLKDL